MKNQFNIFNRFYQCSYLNSKLFSSNESFNGSLKFINFCFELFSCILLLLNSFLPLTFGNPLFLVVTASLVSRLVIN